MSANLTLQCERPMHEQQKHSGVIELVAGILQKRRVDRRQRAALKELRCLNDHLLSDLGIDRATLCRLRDESR